MASSRNHECDLVREILPQMGEFLEEDLRWLGSPEDKQYSSEICNGDSALDAELGGSIRLAVEHTRVESVESQLRLTEAFRPVREMVFASKESPPLGNYVEVTAHCLEESALVRRKMRARMPEIEAWLTGSLSMLEPLVGLEDDGTQLAQPQDLDFGDVRFTLRTSPFPDERPIIFKVQVEEDGPDLPELIRTAIDRKSGSAKTAVFRAYRDAGWRTMLLLERSDPFLHGPQGYIPAISRAWQENPIEHVDCVGLVDASLSSPDFYLIDPIPRAITNGPTSSLVARSRRLIRVLLAGPESGR